MKTIEQAAKNCDKSKAKHFRREHSSSEFYTTFEDGFKAGAEWMNKQWEDKFRWISFEEKFPPMFEEFEVKDVRGRVFNIKKLFDTSYLYLVKNYSSWRITPKV